MKTSKLIVVVLAFVAAFALVYGGVAANASMTNIGHALPTLGSGTSGVIVTQFPIPTITHTALPTISHFPIPTIRPTNTFVPHPTIVPNPCLIAPSVCRPIPPETILPTPTIRPTPTITPVPSTLDVTLVAQPHIGYAPLSSVLTATVNGTASGPISYRLDCNNDQIFEDVIFNSWSTQISHICQYANPGLYQARVIVQRDGQQAEATALVRVLSAIVTPTPNILPTVDLRANGDQNSTTVNNGDNVNLSWTSSQAQYCYASNGWSGYKATAGNETIFNVISTTLYTLTCVNSYGSASDSVTVSTQPIAISNLSLMKTVRDITTGSNFQSQISANPGDVLEFSIDVTANNTYLAHNVRVSDTLPFGLAYMSGTTTLNGSNYILVGYGYTDGITNGGINIGDLYTGQHAIIKFRAQVSPETTFVYGTNTITNTAYATSSDNSAQVSSQATIYVTRTNNTVIDTSNPMSILKFGRDITRGQTTEHSSLSVRPGDTLEFIIHIRSLVNNTLDNVMVRDALPEGLSYINQSTTVNGYTVGDGITSNTGINIGSLNPGREVVVRFQVTVNPAGAFAKGTTYTANVAYVSMNGSTTTIDAHLPISIMNGSLIGGASHVTTGPADSIALALALSAMLTAGYFTYSKTRLFKNRELAAVMARHSSINLAR